jgi:hypothetical protein
MSDSPSLELRLRRRLKSLVLGNPLLRGPASAYLRARLHREYAALADGYARRAREAGLSYDAASTTADVRARLARRGAPPRRRTLGAVRTFAFVPGISWHADLLPDLEKLGPVVRFDYASLGFQWEEFSRASRRGLRDREEMNELFFSRVREEHAREPLDWVFVYASGCEIKASIVRRISEELGLPTVNMCLDDKNSWRGPWMGDHSAGQIGIAGAFDLSWTSSRVACEWYMVEGGRPLYLPPGFDAAAAEAPPSAGPDIPVSFVGEAYGFRRDVVDFLRRRDVPIQAFGRGWEGGALTPEEKRSVVARSRVNLGMGGLLHAEDLVALKGRDFEIPAAGGGVYLTSFNPDLADHFEIGKEILCYRDREEMIRLIRNCLQHPEDAVEISRRGRARCLKEHRWLNRYRRVCALLGLLDED